MSLICETSQVALSHNMPVSSAVMKVFKLSFVKFYYYDIRK